jgi:glycosyltransferase involved in cell wall biosynthesis
MRKSYREEQVKNNGNYPLVSVGVPTFNSGKRIVTALMSVLHQEYPNLEVIISDNCSSDNTQAVCTELCRDHPDLRYFRQKENIGLVPNFEFVLSQASGDLFMWIADDDSLEPGILQKYVDFLTRHPDYTLVSGQIRYWSEDGAVFDEKDFTMDDNSGDRRVIRFYSKVKYGAIYYGLMPRETAKKVPLGNRMGEDWHFIAKVAYLGKIKNLDCIGYNKKLNGSSKNFKQYAKIIGASWFSANFPHIQIAIDAFSEIMSSPIYGGRQTHSKVILALSSSAGILINFYCREYPFIMGGKIIRLLGFKKMKGLKGKIIARLKKKASVLIPLRTF